MHLALDHDAALTIPIPRPARACYELFCDAARTPEWVAVVKSAAVDARDAQGRPTVVAFLASFTRATIGYSLLYRYNAEHLSVTWRTRGSGIRVWGSARFAPLGERASLMTYDLVTDCGGVLADWSDPFFQGHAASAVMNDFREFANHVL